jgi:hypothetical protein
MDMFVSSLAVLGNAPCKLKLQIGATRDRPGWLFMDNGHEKTRSACAKAGFGMSPKNTTL